MEKHTGSTGRHFIHFALISALVMVVMALSVWSFSNHLEQTERNLQRQLLMDIAQQRSNYMDARIEGYLDTLHGIASFFGEELVKDAESVERLKNVAATSEFLQVGVADADGMLLGTDGSFMETMDIGGRGYWNRLQEGSGMISGVKGSYTNRNRTFYVGVPIQNGQGDFAGAVIGVVDLEDFETNEQAREDMSGYRSYVVDQSGNYVLRDNEDDLSWNYGSIFSQLAANDSGFDGQAVWSCMSRNLPAETETTMDGVETLLYFSPMELNNWYTVAALPQAEIKNHISTLLDRELYLLLAKLLAAVLVLAGVVAFNVRRVAIREREALREKAERDVLTGLYNRSAARVRISEMLEGQVCGAMVMLDLDNFKNLNDTLGHQCGDRALRDVAAVLLGNTRQGDVVCRLGGDEFALYLPTLTEENIEKKMDRLLNALVLTYREEGQEVTIGASAGVALFPDDAADVDSLYTKSDEALYEAKRKGKGRFCRAAPGDGTGNSGEASE